MKMHPQNEHGLHVVPRRRPGEGSFGRELRLILEAGQRTGFAIGYLAGLKDGRECGVGACVEALEEVATRGGVGHAEGTVLDAISDKNGPDDGGAA